MNIFMQEISKLVDDSIPAKKSLVVVTSPGSFFRKQRFVRLSLKRTGESCLKKKLQIN
jgi:HAE1 family hydrophobic/amphiphilic exporter-1/multidrug efflux pump